MDKHRLKCRVCGRRMTVIDPKTTRNNVCPYCQALRRKEEEERQAQARRNSELTQRIWWADN